MSNAEIVTAPFRLELEQGLALAGRIETPADGPAPAVLLLAHGFRGSKDWGFWPYVSRWFAGRGYYTVSFNYSRIDARARGFDERRIAAASTVSQELADLAALLDAVTRGALPFADRAPRGRVVLLGHSRSGTSSVLFASERPEIGTIVVWNGGVSPAPPAGDPEAWSLVERAVAADAASHPQRGDVAGTLAALAAPALLVQGGADAARVLEASRLLRAAAPGHSFVDIAGADHTFQIPHPFTGTNAYLEAALEASASFLARHTGASQPVAD